MQRDSLKAGFDSPRVLSHGFTRDQGVGSDAGSGLFNTGFERMTNSDRMRQRNCAQ